MQKNRHKKSKKKIIISIIFFLIIFVAIILLFFSKNTSKVFKNGNNMSNQEIANFILGISSYKTNVTVEINSNKNTNKYVLNQEYISPNQNTQEIEEPENIAGIKITRNENTLTLENTKYNLSTVFENYDYIADNCLDLSTFIKDYQESDSSSNEDDGTQIVMKTVSANDNKYIKYKTLYVDKKTKKPTKLVIKDDNQKATINIQYNMVEINS